MISTCAARLAKYTTMAQSTVRRARSRAAARARSPEYAGRSTGRAGIRGLPAQRPLVAGRGLRRLRRATSRRRGLGRAAETQLRGRRGGRRRRTAGAAPPVAAADPVRPPGRRSRSSRGRDRTSSGGRAAARPRRRSALGPAWPALSSGAGSSPAASPSPRRFVLVPVPEEWEVAVAAAALAVAHRARAPRPSRCFSLFLRPGISRSGSGRATRGIGRERAFGQGRHVSAAGRAALPVRREGPTPQAGQLTAATRSRDARPAHRASARCGLLAELARERVGRLPAGRRDPGPRGRRPRHRRR